MPGEQKRLPCTGDCEQERALCEGDLEQGQLRYTSTSCYLFLFLITDYQEPD